MLHIPHRVGAVNTGRETITTNHRPYRLAVLASHPIQYQTPLFRALAAKPEMDLTVFFCSDWGLKAYRDEGFQQHVKWDLPLLEGYRSEFLPNVSPRPNSSRFWGLINPVILQRLRKENFDAVCVHGWARLTDWLAMLTAFFLDIPVLLRAETNLLPSLPLWKVILKRAVLTRLFKRVSAFLAIGRHNAEFYRAYGVPKERIFHVPYAVDNNFFLAKAEELLPKQDELRRKFGIPEDLPVILFSGKLREVKQPMDLLRAFAEVSKTTKVALVYVGDGLLRSELEAYVQEHSLERVYFMGFQNQTELPMFYAMADIFVLPSGFDPWGLVVNEAMAFSLPVIVSDQVGAGGDLVMEGVNGFIYPAGDVVALAERLRELVSDKSMRHKLGKTSRAIIKRWSYEEGIQEILTCLEKIGSRLL